MDTQTVESLGLLKERLCLDFVNTSDEHPSKPNAEFLTSYAEDAEQWMWPLSIPFPTLVIR